MDDNVHELFPRSDTREPSPLEKHLSHLKEIIDGEVTEPFVRIFQSPFLDLEISCLHIPENYETYLENVKGLTDRRLEAFAIFALATKDVKMTQLKIAASALMLSSHCAVKEPEHKLANAGLVIYFYRTVNNTVCVLKIQAVKPRA